MASLCPFQFVSLPGNSTILSSLSILIFFAAFTNLAEVTFFGEKMITVIVTFKISEGINSKILKEKFIETSTLYQDVKGLLRKNYISDIDNGIAGGIYTFASREDANNWFDDRVNWIADRY